MKRDSKERSGTDDMVLRCILAKYFRLERALGTSRTSSKMMRASEGRFFCLNTVPGQESGVVDLSQKKKVLTFWSWNQN